MAILTRVEAMRHIGDVIDERLLRNASTAERASILNKRRPATLDAPINTGRNRNMALITDGRVSGFNRSLIIRHINTEAAIGAQIALIEKDNIIEIDFSDQRLQPHVDDVQLHRRRSERRPHAEGLRIGAVGSIHVQLWRDLLI